MKHRIEDDSNINEAYLNQNATGDEQQRDPNNNLKYPAKLDSCLLYTSDAADE